MKSQNKRYVRYKLAEKIKRDLGIDCDPETFERKYAGKNQKAMGSWVWTMMDNIWLIGSAEPASKLIKSKYYLSIDEKTGEIFGEEY